MVLDPLNDEWPADYQTSDPDEFLRVFWDSRQCAVFLDESGDFLKQWAEDMKQTATRGRHWGHRCHFVAQRSAQIAMTVRDQCSDLFLFASSHKDAQTHAEEWNHPQLIEAPNLPKGTYFHCTRFQAPQKLKVF